MKKKEGDCIDRNITGIIGYDKVIKKDKYDDKFMLLGGFVKISEHNIKQGKNNEGKLVKSGIGFIGKVEGKKREIRAIVDGSYDIYDTKRCVRFEAYNRGEFEEVEEVNRIEGKFKGIGIGCDLEGAIKLRTKKNIIVRPYIGMEARVNNYDKIKEDGAGYGLVVEGNSYTRVLGRLGIGVRQEKEWYGWNVKGEYKLLLSKEVPTIKAGFDGSNEKFEVVGNEEGRQVLGVGGGVSCKITDRVECFANTNYHIGYKYKAMQANIGISYKIGTLTPNFVKRSIKMKKELNKYIYEGLFDKIKQYKKKI